MYCPCSLCEKQSLKLKTLWHPPPIDNRVLFFLSFTFAGVTSTLVHLVDAHLSLCVFCVTVRITHPTKEWELHGKSIGQIDLKIFNLPSSIQRFCVTNCNSSLRCFFVPNFIVLLWLYDECMAETLQYNLWRWNLPEQSKWKELIRILWWEFKALTICAPGWKKRKRFKSIWERGKQFESDSLAEIGQTKMSPDRSERGENPPRVSE